MLQNFIAAGSLSDSSAGEITSSVAGALDVLPGEGTAINARRASKVSPFTFNAPLPENTKGQKRPAEDSSNNGASASEKRTRFTKTA
jgi:hypothetical protein